MGHIRTSIVVFICALTACAYSPRSSRSKIVDEVSPKDVPEGYTARECHYVIQEGSTGGGFTSANAAMEASAHTHKEVNCEHLQFHHP